MGIWHPKMFAATVRKGTTAYDLTLIDLHVYVYTPEITYNE